jgi:hypothetical protein
MEHDLSSVRILEYNRGIALARWNTHARSCYRCECDPQGRGLKPHCRAGRTQLALWRKADKALRDGLAALQAPVVTGALF